MAEEPSSPGVSKSKEEIALELMKFVAVTTGYGKGAPGAGFSGKVGKTPEEYAESLIQLYKRCRDLMTA